MKITRFFTDTELCCKCCGDLPAQEDSVLAFYDALDQLRSEVRFKFSISEAYRCPARDRKVSLNIATAGKGVHTFGTAAHIMCYGAVAHKLLKPAFEIFTGIGITQVGDYEKRYIHLDTITAEEGGIANYGRPWVWSHRESPSMYAT